MRVPVQQQQQQQFYLPHAINLLFTFFQLKICKTGSYSVKMGYKSVMGWTSGRASLCKTLGDSPPHPSGKTIGFYCDLSVAT